MPEAYIYSALRTPVARLGGGLSHVRPDDLAARLLAELVSRTDVDPSSIEDVILGCANQAGEDCRNVARLATLLAGYPVTVPGVTVNRLCASGLHAVSSAAQAIKAGEAELIVAGGVESMTRAPQVTLKAECTPLGDGPESADSTIGWRFTNPALPKVWTIPFGETAERIADRYQVDRAVQDEYALDSHRKALAAWREGRFVAEVVPYSGSGTKRDENKMLSRDEHPRKGLEMRTLARLKPAFRPDGSVTAGNSSGLSDGAAALLLGVGKLTTRDGSRFEPLARVVASTVTGVEPDLMGLGPISAVKKLLARTGIAISDVDLIELSEAFAAQAIACIEELKLSPERVNVNGGAIALGYPLGCAGARLVVTLVHELRRRKARYGLVAMCTAVGQGAAMLIERRNEAC